MLSSEFIDAVPRRICLPRDVIGLLVPGRFPLKIELISFSFLAFPTIAVLENPVIGRPEAVTGLIDASLEKTAVFGLNNDVPGLGTDAMEFSSNNISEIPSSSSSVSSIQD